MSDAITKPDEPTLDQRIAVLQVAATIHAAILSRTPILAENSLTNVTTLYETLLAHVTQRP